jgi:menaquinone-dependent protoporphyrinogen oxidase
MTVWVIVASKYGSTQEVAEAMAEVLRQSHDVEVRDAAETGGLDGAEAVVLGSAIYGGHWLAPARELVDQHAAELASLPTWLFSVGPIGDPPKPMEVGPEGIDEVLEATQARSHQVFAGRLDYGRLGRIERLMVRALHAPEGDFRDWEAIRAWASLIATELQTS